MGIYIENTTGKDSLPRYLSPSPFSPPCALYYACMHDNQSRPVNYPPTPSASYRYCISFTCASCVLTSFKANQPSESIECWQRVLQAYSHFKYGGGTVVHLSPTQSLRTVETQTNRLGPGYSCWFLCSIPTSVLSLANFALCAALSWVSNCFPVDLWARYIYAFHDTRTSKCTDSSVFLLRHSDNLTVNVGLHLLGYYSSVHAGILEVRTPAHTL